MAGAKIVSEIRFKPTPREGSLIGWVSFLYDKKFAFKGISVHEKADKTGYRLLYPENAKKRTPIHPIDPVVQKQIDSEITSFIKGANDDQSTGSEPNFNNPSTYDKQLGRQ